MLSIRRIEHDLTHGRAEALLKALLEQAPQLPHSLRLRLASHPLAIAALGLRRLAELSYVPTALMRTLIAHLLEAQQPDGSFDADPLATASAAAGLRAVLASCAVRDPAVAAAHRRALDALAAMQSPQAGVLEQALPRFACPDDRTLEDQAATAAFILWLLTDDPAFRETVRFAELMDWFEQHHRRLDDATDQLWRLARANGGRAGSRWRPAVAMSA